MGKIVGIDLGTTFSAIAHIDKHGKPVIIHNKDGDRLTPSVIRFESPGRIAVGKAAAQNALAFPKETVTGVKSNMGRPKEEAPYTFHGKTYSADELSAMILTKLKQDAEASLRRDGEIPENEDITGACITVPVSFNNPERNATKNAATIAGFKEVTLIDEPIASAYACCASLSDQTVLVADLGGGTNDVSLLKISDEKIEVVAKNGNRELGGGNWDKAIVEYVAEEFKKQHKIYRGSAADVQRLVDEAVRAKEVLSTSEETRITHQHDGKSIAVPLTRQDFENLSVNHVENYKSQCQVALSEGEMEWDDVDTVLLVGGSTRMPMIQKAIAELSGKEIDLPKVDPDIAVALGAAIRGEDLLNPSPSAANEPKLINVASNHLGVVVYDDKRKKYVVDLIIEAGEKIPCDNERDYLPQRARGKEGLAVDSVVVSIVQGLEQDAPIDIDKLNDHPHLLGSLPLDMPQGALATDKIRLVWKYNADEIVEVEAKGPDDRTEKVEIDTSGLDPEEVKEAAGFLQRQEIM